MTDGRILGCLLSIFFLLSFYCPLTLTSETPCLQPLITLPPWHMG